MDDPISFTEQLERARIRCGLTAHEAAKRSKLTSPSYYDLESCEEEHSVVYSVIELLRVAGAVKTSLSQLLSIPPELEPVSLKTLVDELKIRSVKSGLSLDEYSTQLGWELMPLLSNPRELYVNFSLDGLKFVCQATGVNWQSVVKQMENHYTSSRWLRIRVACIKES